MWSINRTKLELKFELLEQVKDEALPINRTKLELKSVCRCPDSESILPINRTKLELKCANKFKYLFLISLLIAPNWN